MSITFSRKTAALLVALAVFLLFGRAAWTPPAAAEETAVGTPSVAKQGDNPFADPFARQRSVESSRRPDPFGAAPKPADSAEAGGSSSHPATRPDRRPLATGEEAILAALGEKSTAEFFDSPLQDLVDWFQELHRVRIVLDKRALDIVGLGSDSPVTCDIADVSFRSALELVLRDLDLTWTIQNEVLMITTSEEVELRLLTRVYEVADLVDVRDQDGQTWEDYDSLVDMIRTGVEPASWDRVGGPGSVVGSGFGRASVLVIRQTYPIHETIAQLLEDLRAAGENGPSNMAAPARYRPDPPPGATREVTFGMTGRPTPPQPARGGGFF